jgi:hypothetical protein
VSGAAAPEPQGRASSALRADPRPRLAQAARDYADAWSVYVQWQYDRKRLVRAGLDADHMDAYFDHRLYQLGVQLREAAEALTTVPEAQPAPVDTPTTDTLDNRGQVGNTPG